MSASWEFGAPGRHTPRRGLRDGDGAEHEEDMEVFGRVASSRAGQMPNREYGGSFLLSRQPVDPSGDYPKANVGQSATPQYPIVLRTPNSRTGHYSLSGQPVTGTMAAASAFELWYKETTCEPPYDRPHAYFVRNHIYLDPGVVDWRASLEERVKQVEENEDKNAVAFASPLRPRDQVHGTKFDVRQSQA